MAGPDRVELGQQFPLRAVRRLGWCTSLGAAVIVLGFVLFGAEPSRLESGRANPLALVPTGLTALFALVAIPFVLALFRRPVVAADHYALSVRPGILRTLLLPWARIVEIAAHRVRDERFLLVRCRTNQLGDRPRWWDQAVLRAAARSAASMRRNRPDILEYDVAVRMDEFVGDPANQLAALAAFAPHYVIVADDSSRTGAYPAVPSPRRPRQPMPERRY